MTHLLEKVFSKVEKFSESEQNAIAKWLLNEISSERKWDKALVESEKSLTILADEALKEYKSKKTRPLDLDHL